MVRKSAYLRILILKKNENSYDKLFLHGRGENFFMGKGGDVLFIILNRPNVFVLNVPQLN